MAVFHRYFFCKFSLHGCENRRVCVSKPVVIIKDVHLEFAPENNEELAISITFLIFPSFEFPKCLVEPSLFCDV